jgi:hypothetical protein
MQHPLQCRCGTIKGWISDTHRANHVVCYCRDCQAFARFLGQESETLDAQGGSEIVQITPKNVTFTQGTDALACMRLTDKGMIRWYASCCKTPIGNTLENYKISFVGLLHNCLETPQHSLQNSFGAIRTYANPHGAIGDPKPKASGVFAMIWWFVTIILKARINGDYKRTPFFKDGRPIANPRVISGAERTSAMQTPAR